jgi:hypothetical protein
METWGIGAVTNYGGESFAWLSVVLWGIAAGTLGYFLARWYQTIGEKAVAWKQAIPTTLMTLFLMGFWFYVRGWSFLYDTDFWNWGLFTGLWIVGLSFVSYVWIQNRAERLSLRNGTRAKEDRFSWMIFSIVSICLMMLSVVVELPLVTLNLGQRASFYAKSVLKKTDATTSDIQTAIASIEQYGYKLQPISKAFLHLQLKDNAGAVVYFREYARANMKTAGGEHNLWFGMANYYDREFVEAAEQFEKVGEAELAIFALFSGKILTVEKFQELSEKVPASSAIVRDIGTAVLPSPKVVKTDMSVLLARIEQLEQRLLKKEKTSAAAEEQPQLQARVDKEMLFLVHRGVSEPLLDVAYEEYGLSLAILLVLSYPLLFACVYVTAWVWRDWLWDYFSGGKCAFLTRFVFRLGRAMSWHSSIARRLSLRLIAMESQAGMFNTEMTRIRSAVFPADIFLALRFIMQAKKTTRRWNNNEQERADVQYVFTEIRKLSGKLIPQGTEESLSVITGLRRQADEIKNNYLKNIILYEQARTMLFELLSELATVGDILDARRTGNSPTYYDFLGIGAVVAADEIKRGYRAVIQAVHPDRNNGNVHLTELAMQINAAYAVLSNPTRRQAYDVGRKF